MQPAPSKIPAQPERKAHYGQLWDDIADNQRLLADCELRFMIALCRRGWNSQLSDQSWEASTGLHIRMKARAIAGLRKKGLVQTGQGKAARYSFDRKEWAAYTHRNRDTEVKARTEGRKVCAKPGQQIHPICRDRGCQRLCEEKAVIPINSITTTPNQTLVSGIDSESPQSPPISPPFFPLTLAALRKLFPGTTDDMPQKIAAACEAQGVKGFSDEQLSSSLERALRPGQKSAGLFLRYIPAALRALLSQPKIPGTRQVSNSIAAYLQRTATALRAANLENFAQMIDAVSADSPKLDQELEEIEIAVLKLLPEPQNLAHTIQKELKPYRDKMSRDQLERLAEQVRRRATFEAAGLGMGISLFCV